MIKEVKRIFVAGLILNIVLTIIKLLGGYLGKSNSLVSDGYNSLSDIFISSLLLIFITISNKKADKNHPYGHEKYEGIISFVLGLFLMIMSLYIIYLGINDLFKYDNTIVYEKPKLFTIVVAVISILIKLIIYFINIKGYKKYNQISLKADAYNHLGDIFATSASLIGIVLASISFVYFDYIASIIIGLIIFKNGFDVTKEAISFLVDEAPSKDEIKNIKKSILEIDGVMGIDDFKARKHMNKIYVDVEIAVSKKLSLIDAHKIAEDVHLKIEDKYENVIHCMVHVNPR
ncbi:cation diffusion facilitator family transporter [Haploplasma axanthum]|uniref:Cadmium, cobalt and zinc/H(+)-K(+) antiporter n=1 Tax=Haploplasma axanthum TaxID=29552 RepID=A0A449BCH6_HAPAX|nr:cation diffusion facilitator family transporter [Haploplasma axanthum]VEU80135.1 Cadmium, cobalt and zinc/H(+)-K(+) antiporter [Haploplasma axanthum]